MSRLARCLTGALLTLIFTGAASAPATSKLIITGTIKSGVVAAGGETTGIEISQGSTRFELDIKDAALRKKAEELNGKQATVKGTLTVKQGIETGQRLIILVESLEAAAKAS